MSQDSEESRRRLARENAALAEIGRVVSSALHLDEVYERFAAAMSKAIPFDRMSVATFNVAGDQFSHAYVIGVEVPGWNVADVIDFTRSVNQWSMSNRKGHMLGEHAEGLVEGAQKTEALARSRGLLSGMTVPLVWDDQIIGTFNLRSKRANAYGKSDLEFAERAGAQVAGAIANAQLHASLQRQSTERETLATIGRIITSTLDINEIYRPFAEELRKLISFDRIVMATVDLEAETLTHAFVEGTDVPGWGAGRVLSVSDAVVQRAIHDRKGYVTESELAVETGLRTSMTVPLVSNDQVIAIFNLRSKEPNAYGEKDLELAERVGAQVAGAIASAQLFEERRRAEEALRLTQFSVDQSVDPAFWIGPKAQFIYVNDAACRSLGHSRKQLLSMTVHDIDLDSSPKDWPAHWKELAEKSSLTFESQHKAADGRVFPVEITANYVEFGGEKYNFVFARDISRRKELERQLRQSQKMEAVGTLAGGVAHDFNNMLSAIVGYADLTLTLMQPEATEQMRAYLGEVLTAADRAAHLTRQLLTFSRHRPVEPRVLSLNEIVVNIDKLLRRLIRANIELVTLPHPDLELVNVDPGQMEQVLMNMVVNATDAMPDGGKLVIETTNVTVDARLAPRHSDLKSGEYVTMRVSDNGTGMDEEVRTHIFEPFYTTKEVGRGTGLGLSTCYGIVAQSGGYIAVDSELGVGSTFTIFLPVATEAAEELPLHDDAGFLPSGSEVVTVVEDEPLVRSATTTVLRQQGYKVTEAAIGAEAIRIAQEQATDIDLLLTDVVMPLMGGAELAERFGELHPEARVLYTSGYTDDPRIRREPGGTSEPFIFKPFTPRELAQKVREVLDAVGPSEGHKRE